MIAQPRLASFLTLTLFAGGLALAAPYEGRFVGEVLDELRGEGLTFIYSSRVLAPALRVKEEPHAQRGLALAEELLAAHGLAISKAAPRVYVVIRRPDGLSPPVAQAPVPVPSDSLEQVVVQTSRYTLSTQSAAPPAFLTQDEVQNMPRLADETLRSVQRLPGSASNGFSSLGSLRGGEPDEVGIILNGLRLHEPFHLKNFLSPVSLLDSRIIESIEVYSGGFPVAYGDRMSGILDARTVRPVEPRYYELGLNLFHASALAASGFDEGRGHLLVSGRRSNVGDLARFSEKDFGKPHYSDGFAQLDYRLSDATRGELNFLFSTDKIDAVRSGGAERATARYRNLYGWGRLERDWSDRAASRFVLSLTDLSNRRSARIDEPGERTGRVDDQRDFRILGARADTSIEADLLLHRFGAEVRRLWGRYDYFNEIATEADHPFPGSPGLQSTSSATPRPNGYEVSAYWDVLAELGERWTVQGGLRVDTQTYDESGDDEQWSPRLSVRYAAGPRTHLRASWGRFHQSQDINELQVEDGIDRFHGAERATHSIASVDHSFEAGFDLRVEVYRKDYRRLSPRFENIFDPLVLFPEAELDRVRIDPRRSRAEGIELLLRMRPRRTWSGWASYAWARVEDRVAGGDVPRSWDQRHALSVGAVWAKGPWSATLADTFHTGWPTTELSIVNDAAGIPRIDLARRNRDRFEPYNALDLRITRTFVVGLGALDVFAELNNALSRENPCCAQYEVTRAADGSLAIRRQLDTWLPRVPSAGVLWRY